MHLSASSIDSLSANKSKSLIVNPLALASGSCSSLFLTLIRGYLIEIIILYFLKEGFSSSSFFLLCSGVKPSSITGAFFDEHPPPPPLLAATSASLEPVVIPGNDII